MNYLTHLDENGFPVKKTPDNKIQLLYKKKIFLFSKFKRRFDICLVPPNFNLIKGYYHDKLLDTYYYDKLRTLKLFFPIKINFKLLAFLNYFFLKKKKIKLNNDEIALFGPYSHSYSHAIHEFFTRLMYLKKKNKKFNIFLPKNLEKILSSKLYKFVFPEKNFNFKFFDVNHNYEFINCNYLTHPNNRWVVKDNKKKISTQFKKLLNDLRKEVTQAKIFNKKKTPKYIIVSRSNALRRRLLNEENLCSQLKKYGFKKIFFEKLSFEKQAELSMNCKIMIGYHGAGLTNLVFMKKNTHLIEIFNKHYENEHFKLFSMCQNIKYKNFQCKENKKNLDGICNVNQVEKYVKKIIG